MVGENSEAVTNVAKGPLGAHLPMNAIGIFKNNRVGLVAYAARLFILAIWMIVLGMRTRLN